MPRPYYPLALWNYTPVLNAMPALPINSATEAPLVCVQFSAALVPYVLGLLEIYRWSDKFKGTQEEVNKSLGIIQDFIVLLTEGNCPDCPENPMPTVWKFTAECGLEYSNDNGGTWNSVPGWSSFAEACFKGDQGESGPVGPVGPVGPSGEDCECTDPVPVQPPVPVGEDRCVTACNIAFGLGDYFYQQFEDKLDWLEAAFEATTILTDLAGDFIEAFPVLGALVDAVINFIESVAETDIPALRGENNAAFKENMQCKLYELMANDTDEFTAVYLDGIRQELQSYMLLLPPQGPLLTLIGQSYAGLLGLFSPNELLRRANLYKDNEGECGLCDVDCGNCSTELIHNFVQNPVTDDYGWSLVAAGIPADWSCGDATFNPENTWSGSRTTSGWTVGTAPFSMGIQRNFGAEGFTLCKAFVNIGNSTGDNNTRISVLWVKRASDGVWQSLVCQRRSIGNNNGPALSWEGNIEITDMLIACGVGGGTMTISRVDLNETP